MKKLTLIMMMALAAGMFQACNNSAKDTVETADSVNAEMDTSTSAAQDGADGVAEVDAKFAVDASNGGMTEVALSTLAEQKADNTAVKSFAAMMVEDHGKANGDLTELAVAKQITLPESPGEQEQKTIADLNLKTGADFDKSYVDIMVKEHNKAVALFEDASKNLVDTQLKAFAINTLPTLKAHQAHAKTLQDKMK